MSLAPHALLTREQEVDLLRRHKAGDKRAAGELLLGNRRLIQSIIWKWRDRGVDVEELFQEGCIAFMRTLETFDYRRGTRLSTLASYRILSRVRYVVARQRLYSKRETAMDTSGPVSPLAGMESTKSQPDAMIERLDQERRAGVIHQALSELSERDRTVAEGRLMSDPPVFCAEIGKQVGLSKSWVTRVEQGVVAKLRTRLADLEAA